MYKALAKILSLFAFKISAEFTGFVNLAVVIEF